MTQQNTGKPNVAAVKDLQRGDRGWRRRSPRSFGSSKATLGVLHVTFMEPRSLREALLGSYVVSEWWERGCCLV